MVLLITVLLVMMVVVLVVVSRFSGDAGGIDHVGDAGDRNEVGGGVWCFRWG